jgi:hypothetical protein
MAGEQGDVDSQLHEPDPGHDRGQGAFATLEAGGGHGDSRHQHEHHCGTGRAAAGCDVSSHPETDARRREDRDTQPQLQCLERAVFRVGAADWLGHGEWTV